MARLRVHAYSVSLDGFGAGPSQSVDEPLGIGGEDLHQWMFSPDRTPDDDRFFRELGFDGIGAWVMGRNMFGPVRGPWPDDSWRGWWGDEPPYHCDVFVLTHHERDSLTMTGGTTFHFVTSGLDDAVSRAFDAAGGEDVRLGGGASTIRAAIGSGLVDWMHLAVVPITLGSGERLLGDGIGLDDFTCTELVSSTTLVSHMVFERS